MKKYLYILLFYSLGACVMPENTLLGEWRLQSSFYQATYKIVEEGNRVKALLLYYNDDTTIYEYKANDEHYVFKDLALREGTYTDATAGATTSATDEMPLQLKILHRDTLEITSYVLNKPLKEVWIRNNKH